MTSLKSTRAEAFLSEQLAHLATHDAAATAMIERFAASRRALAADPYRPLYHFSPPENWMNDPNGLSHWHGLYHMGYQFKPEGEERVHWGHTVSPDMIHWHDLPIALYPNQEKDCYSGQTLVEKDRVIAIYHGTQAGNAIATADDTLLVNWQKHPQNPVMPIVPTDENGLPYTLFDPCIWKEDDGYYYALSGTHKQGRRAIDCVGVDYIFRSKDLTDWEYLGEMLESKFYTEPGEDAAVPNFWPITNHKHMLLFFSHKRAAQYFVGDYDRSTYKFTPTSHGRMNFGPIATGSLHAPSSFIDDQGRYIAIFSVKEGKPPTGWNDVMTLPRQLVLNEDETLSMSPLPETDSLRFDHKSVEPTTIPANQEIVLDGLGGKAIEIRAEIDPGDAREVGLYVLRSPDSEERTRISFYQNTHRRFNRSALQIDVSESTTRNDVFARPPETGDVGIGPGEKITLRIYIDRSIIEVYANDKQCVTVRVYPEREDSRGISLFARGASAQLLGLDVWQMRSIWPELEDKEGQ